MIEMYDEGDETGMTCIVIYGIVCFNVLIVTNEAAPYTIAHITVYLSC